MNQISKFFALLGLSASMAIVGTGCVGASDEPESELGLADDSAEVETLQAHDDRAEDTAENEAALTSSGYPSGYGYGDKGE